MRLGRHTGRRLGSRGFGQPIRPRGHTGRCCRSPGDDLRPAHQRRGRLRDLDGLRPCKHDSRAGIAEDVHQLLDRQMEVDGHARDAGLQCSEIGDDRLGAVVREHGDAGGVGPSCQQRIGRPVQHGVERRPGERLALVGQRDDIGTGLQGLGCCEGHRMLWVKGRERCAREYCAALRWSRRTRYSRGR